MSTLMLIVTLFNCSGIQPTSHSTMDETPTVTPADIVARVRGNNQHDMAATPSTSQTATSADEEDNSASDNTPSHLDASTVERVATVVQEGCISLDSKLSVFTVLGSTEPHVVKLFPCETCSCPATAVCYYIVAAQRAVGITGTDRRRAVNLTQLRRNKRKRADKTGGWKRPRTADVDVVVAPVTLSTSRAGLCAALLGSPGLAPSSAPPASPAIDTEICHSCDAIEPPPLKNAKRHSPVNWVKCDACPHWYHTL